NIDEVELSPEIFKLVPPATARMYQCLPLAVFGNSLRVALADPLNPSIVDELSFTTQKEIQVVVADPVRVLQEIEKIYPASDENIAEILKALGEDVDLAKEMEAVAGGQG